MDALSLARASWQFDRRRTTAAWSIRAGGVGCLRRPPVLNDGCAVQDIGMYAAFRNGRSSHHTPVHVFHPSSHADMLKGIVWWWVVRTYIRYNTTRYRMWLYVERGQSPHHVASVKWRLKFGCPCYSIRHSIPNTRPISKIST